MKRILPLLLIIALVVASSGCTASGMLNLFEKALKESGDDTNGTVPFTDDISHPGKIMIGSWNIQNYGTSKASDTATVSLIASVVKEFDLIALQEIVNAECAGGTCSQMTGLMSRLPSNYTYRLSSRVGRSAQKEQYAIVYNKNVFTLLGYEMFEDTYDIFEREPMICEFRKGNDADFMLIVCHIKPDMAPSEISALETVVQFVGTKYSDKDIILLGDLNAGCSYYSGPLLTNMISLIPDYTDTTVGASNCAYDRIFVTNSMSRYVDGVNVGYVYRHSQITKEVSDHYPVYFLWKDVA